MTGTNVDFILKGINEYLMALAKEQIKLAFEQSEKEVADLHQRTREGLLTARLNGKQVGRKKGVGFETKKAREAKQIIRTHCKTFDVLAQLTEAGILSSSIVKTLTLSTGHSKNVRLRSINRSFVNGYGRRDITTIST